MINKLCHSPGKMEHELFVSFVLERLEESAADIALASKACTGSPGICHRALYNLNSTLTLPCCLKTTCYQQVQNKNPMNTYLGITSSQNASF